MRSVLTILFVFAAITGPTDVSAAAPQSNETLDKCMAGDLEACRSWGKAFPHLVSGIELECNLGQLGRCTLLGTIWLLDEPARAEIPLKKACAEIPAACYLAGRSHEKRKQWSQAAALWESSCAKSVMQSCAVLSALYSRGLGVTKDVERAVSLGQRGCDGGRMVGCYNAAVAHVMNGANEHAMRLYQRACEGGHLDACSNLGSLIEKSGADRHLEQAVALYRKACDGGSTAGCTNLGVAFATGKGVPEDIGAAIRPWKRACEGGEATACKYLRDLCVDGKKEACEPGFSR